MQVLFEDNHCLAVLKPAGTLTVGDQTGDLSLLDEAKAYLKRKYQKPGDVFLGVVHRLDRPVSGIVLFARTSKAAARLSEQFRLRTVGKRYLALVAGKPQPAAGELLDWLRKDHDRNLTSVVPAHSPDGLECRLKYEVLETRYHISEVSIELLTGRSHQIRVQFAHRGWPILGDVKYGSQQPLGGKIALHAEEFAFDHPTRHELITLTSPPPASWNDWKQSAKEKRTED